MEQPAKKETPKIDETGKTKILESICAYTNTRYELRQEVAREQDFITAALLTVFLSFAGSKESSDSSNFAQFSSAARENLVAHEILSVV